MEHCPLMPKTTVQSPNGPIVVEHPEGASDEDIIAYAQANAGQQQPQQPQTFMDKLGQTWPARMAKDIYSGVTLPGDVYSGKTQVDPSNPEFMGRATGLAGIAPVGMMPSVIEAAPSASMLKSVGGQQMEQVRNSGLVFNPEGTINGVQTIKDNIVRQERAPETHEILDNLRKKAEVGQPTTIQDILKTRDELRDVQAEAGKGKGRLKESELGAATTAKHLLDDFGNANPNTVISGNPAATAKLLDMANKNLAGGLQSEGLDRRLYASELRAASANSGQNIGNTIRRNVASMLLSPEGRMMRPDVRQQAENVAYGTGPENTLRSFGNTFGGGGGLGRYITGAGAGALAYLASGGSPTITGIATTALPIAGTLAKHASNEMAVSHLAALSEALRSGTPLGATYNRGVFAPGGLKFPGTSEAANAAKAALVRALMTSSPYYPAQ
jgi:hypothetical protein